MRRIRCRISLLAGVLPEDLEKNNPRSHGFASTPVPPSRVSRALGGAEEQRRKQVLSKLFQTRSAGFEKVSAVLFRLLLLRCSKELNAAAAYGRKHARRRVQEIQLGNNVDPVIPPPIRMPALKRGSRVSIRGATVATSSGR